MAGQLTRSRVRRAMPAVPGPTQIEPSSFRGPGCLGAFDDLLLCLGPVLSVGLGRLLQFGGVRLVLEIGWNRQVNRADASQSPPGRSAILPARSPARFWREGTGERRGGRSSIRAPSLPMARRGVWQQGRRYRRACCQSSIRGTARDRDARQRRCGKPYGISRHERLASSRSRISDDLAPRRARPRGAVPRLIGSINPNGRLSHRLGRSGRRVRASAFVSCPESRHPMGHAAKLRGIHILGHAPAGQTVRFA